jgi:RNA polymerase sigma-70 factor, ECF subfamily
MQLNQNDFALAFHQGYAKTARLLVSQGAKNDVAEEVAQEAWAMAWECRSQLRERSRLGPWINSIALNLLRKHWRRGRRRAELCEQAITTTQLCPHVDLRRLLGGFEARDVRLAIGYYVNGYTTREIASLQGVCHSTVRVRLFRLRQALRERLVMEESLALA